MCFFLQIFWAWGCDCELSPPWAHSLQFGATGQPLEGGTVPRALSHSSESALRGFLRSVCCLPELPTESLCKLWAWFCSLSPTLLAKISARPKCSDLGEIMPKNRTLPAVAPGTGRRRQMPSGLKGNNPFAQAHLEQTLVKGYLVKWCLKEGVFFVVFLPF